MNQNIFFVVLLFMLMFLSACEDHGNPVTPPVVVTVDSISFAKDVLPLFTGSTYGCTGCHGGQNNLFLDSYTHVTAGNSNHGPVITPGNGAGSILVKKLRASTVPFGARMPFGGGEVSDADMQKIITWINQGALNN